MLFSFAVQLLSNFAKECRKTPSHHGVPNAIRIEPFAIVKKSKITSIRAGMNRHLVQQLNCQAFLTRLVSYIHFGSVVRYNEVTLTLASGKLIIRIGL